MEREERNEGGGGEGVPGKPGFPCTETAEERGPRLAVVKQPGAVCVYRRNVKPCPVVLVSHVAAADAPHLCVVPLLYRGDTGADETAHLAGREHAAVPATGMVAFRRLKVLVTSRMLDDAPLVLAFELRRYAARNPAHSLRLGGLTAGEFLPLTLAVGSPPNQGDDAYTVVHTVAASPILVVSHSSQVRALASVPSPVPVPVPASVPVPVPSSTSTSTGSNNTNNNTDAVLRVVPSHGPAAGCTRVVILGDLPCASGVLRVLFGRCPAVPTFLGPRSILCTVPDGQQPGTAVSITIVTPTTLITGPSFVFD